MANSNCCNCSGSCGSSYGTGYARRNNNSWFRNSYAALNTVPACTRYRNYPFYTGNCPDACGCYNCGCTAGVTNQNCRCLYGNHCGCNSCGTCDGCNSCSCCDNCNTCGTCGSCNSCNSCDSCSACNSCNSCDACNNCNNCGCCDNCCDGCSTCGCNCTGCGCDHHCRCPVYGLFSANTPLSVTAGAAIPLSATNISDHDFTVSNGTVTIKRCGTYLATYTVNIPSGAELDTTIVMNVNGVAQPSTLLNVSAAGSYTGQTVFKANCGTTVSLVSSAAFSVTDPVGQNIVALTLTRID